LWYIYNMIPIDIHTHTENTDNKKFSIRSFSIIDNNNIPEDKTFSAGIHPWDSERFNHCHFDTLNKISNKNKFVAVGEAGLDKLHGAELQIQKNIFKGQIELSEKTKKPLIIHCVKYFNELIELHKELKPKSPWIIHSFKKNLVLAKDLISRGIYLSFGPDLLNKASNPYKYFSELDKEFIFVETDDSTHSIEEIYKQAAELCEVDLEEMYDIIESNFKKCFKNVPLVK